jgi:hypothetical protein
MSPPKSAGRPPWQPRFTIASMMLVTLVCSVAAAGVSYLVRYNNASGKDGRIGTLLFLLITLAGPLVLVVIVSLGRQIFDLLSRRR